MIIYRCKECGWIHRAERKGDIGTAHAHAEKHASVWKFPSWLLPVADPKILGTYIEELHVKVDEVKRENVFKNPAQVDKDK